MSSGLSPRIRGSETLLVTDIEDDVDIAVTNNSYSGSPQKVQSDGDLSSRQTAVTFVPESSSPVVAKDGFLNTASNSESKSKTENTTEKLPSDRPKQIRFHSMSFKEDEELKSPFQRNRALKLREAIPVIPKRVAIACLALNFIIPGGGKAL